MFSKLYNRIRLFANRRKEPYLLYRRLLGFFPNDISIYEQAFLHKSSAIKDEQGGWINNERLEFLGDAILDAIVADILYHRFQMKKEGFLTNTRSKIVQRETLNGIALELGLDKFIVVSERTRAQSSCIYGNALEALIGAIYIDKGYDVTKAFIEEKMINKFLNLATVAKKEVNFKSKLIEWSQKQKVSIQFELLESFIDEDNKPVFQTQVLLGGQAGGVGIGFSKKESHQNAAQMTLSKLKTDSGFKRLVIESVSKNDKQPVVPVDLPDDLPEDASVGNNEM
ncbi:MAG: ribonuclease III [Bacteroidales bacterium]